MIVVRSWAAKVSQSAAYSPSLAPRLVPRSNGMLISRGRAEKCRPSAPAHIGFSEARICWRMATWRISSHEKHDYHLSPQARPWRAEARRASVQIIASCPYQDRCRCGQNAFYKPCRQFHTNGPSMIEASRWRQARRRFHRRLTASCRPPAWLDAPIINFAAHTQDASSLTRHATSMPACAFRIAPAAASIRRPRFIAPNIIISRRVKSIMSGHRGLASLAAELLKSSGVIATSAPRSLLFGVDADYLRGRWGWGL